MASPTYEELCNIAGVQFSRALESHHHATKIADGKACWLCTRDVLRTIRAGCTIHDQTLDPTVRQLYGLPIYVTMFDTDPPIQLHINISRED